MRLFQNGQPANTWHCQEQSLFAEMEQEHEQVSTVKKLFFFFVGDGLGLQVQLNEWMLDVVHAIVQRICFVFIYNFEKCLFFMCNEDQLKVSGTKHEGYQLQNHQPSNVIS